MSSACIHIAGESFVRVSTVAECFEVEERWVIEIVERGLVESREWQGERVIGCPCLDRVAELRRWSLLGVDLDLIAELL